MDITPEQETLYYDKICRVIDSSLHNCHLMVALRMVDLFKKMVSERNSGMVPILKDKITYKSLELKNEKV